jgi:hypothetical protein
MTPQLDGFDARAAYAAACQRKRVRPDLVVATFLDLYLAALAEAK